MNYTIHTFIPSGEPPANDRTISGRDGTFDVDATDIRDAARIAREMGFPCGRITFDGCAYPHSYTPTHVGA